MKLNKLWILLALIPTLAIAADVKVTGLPEESNPSSTDLLMVVDDPSGSPVSKKIQIGNLLKSPGEIGGTTPAAVMHKHLKEPLVPPDHIVPTLSAGVGEVIERMIPPKGTIEAAFEAAEKLPSMSATDFEDLEQALNAGRQHIPSAWT